MREERSVAAGGTSVVAVMRREASQTGAARSGNAALA
jgi:hypothetical protein